MMDEKVIGRIREAIGSGPLADFPSKETKPERGRLVPRDLDGAKKVSLFKERAESSGARVHVVGASSDVASTIEGILPAGAKVAAHEEDWIPDSLERLEPSKISREELFTLDAAVTDVHLAVAETGSILLEAGEDQARLTSLVAGVHIAIVKRDRIVADLLDWAAEMEKGEELPNGLTLISGPSKTADIELQLVVGVHGPAELHLIVIP